MTTGEVFLGDIATVSTDNKIIRKKLLNMFIIKSPRIGYIEKYSKKNMRHAIRLDPELRQLNINFTGSNNVLIRSKGRKYKFKSLIDIAKVRLLAELNSGSREVNLSFKNKFEFINLPFGDLQFKTRLNSISISPKMCVWIDIFRESDFYKSVPVWANVEIYDSVYIARHYIDKNSIIVENDFIISRKNVAPLFGKHLQVNKFKGELLTKKYIAEGNALRKDNVKKVPAVVAYTVLDATVKEGSVSIQVKVISRKDAEIGEIINVKSLQGGSTLKTIVIGKQLVEII